MGEEKKLQLICCRLPQEAGVSLTLAAALFLSQVRDHDASPPSVTIQAPSTNHPHLQPEISEG
jgi:hypothetical protein